MNHFEINKEKLIDIIRNSLLDTQGFEFYSDETADELRKVDDYVQNAPFLDSEFKRRFDLDYTLAVNGVALDSFDMGLNVGLSLLCELLSGQQPEIIVHCKPPRKAKPAQYQQQTFESNPDFLEFIKRSDKYMNDEEKLTLMTTVSFFMRKHFESVNGISED